MPDIEAVEYVDLDIEFVKAQDRKYTILARDSKGRTGRTEAVLGESRERLKDVELAVLRQGQKRRGRIVSADEKTVRDWGDELFRALFAGPVRQVFDDARGDVRGSARRLRVRLRLDTPELATIPWEILFDTRSDDYLCLLGQTALVRYPDFPQQALPLLVQPPLRVLGMIAAPTDLDELDVGAEKRRLIETFKKLQETRQVELQWVSGQTWRDLLREVQQGPWHVFHFIGHGGFDPAQEEGVIALADDLGRADLLSATKLARILQAANPRMVVLNSCDGARGAADTPFASTAETLVRRDIPAVVAMQYQISDVSAQEFARAFYDALTAGLPVDAAMAQARVALSVISRLEWLVPVLYMRSSDGRLLRIGGRPAPEPPAAAGPGA